MLRSTNLFVDGIDYGEIHPSKKTEYGNLLVPQFGRYVAFTLDPIATVSIYEDPIATDEAKAMPKRTYAGFVDMISGLPSPLRRYHECECYILSQSPPAPDPMRCIEERFCVAIGSSSKHPNGSRHIYPSPPLPSHWGTLYHHTTQSISLRLPTISQNYRGCSTLSDLDMAVLDISTQNDRHDQRLKMQSLSFSSPPVIPDRSKSFPLVVRALDLPQLIDAKPCLQDESPKIDGKGRLLVDRFLHATDALGRDAAGGSERGLSDADSRPDETSTVPDPGKSARDAILDSVLDSLGDVAVQMAQDFFGFEDPRDRFVPVANYTRDLSTVSVLSDARFLLEDIAALRKRSRGTASAESNNGLRVRCIGKAHA
ncbi:hypothetical protein FA95DRAFT_606303 [Auriscalpium vulgare]|uniref:Uncharacterized protein n=1 Tax=Auriscalpium vulgare TaxID=40419 RepID=A0ACB8RF27_9AGAM|nr:hypothetical protein FA95DRAFT_606303 [Auriscalpium vulgare]